MMAVNDFKLKMPKVKEHEAVEDIQVVFAFALPLPGRSKVAKVSKKFRKLWQDSLFYLNSLNVSDYLSNILRKVARECDLELTFESRGSQSLFILSNFTVRPDVESSSTYELVHLSSVYDRPLLFVYEAIEKRLSYRLVKVEDYSKGYFVGTSGANKTRNYRIGSMTHVNHMDTNQPFVMESISFSLVTKGSRPPWIKYSVDSIEA